MKRMIKIILPLAAILLVLNALLRWQGQPLFREEAAVRPETMDSPAPDEPRAMSSAAPAGAIHESPAPALLPENTMQETFRPSEYQDEVTITVTYGEGEPSVVTVTQNGETLQTFTEAGDAERSCVLHFMTVADVNFDGYLDFRFTFATYAGADVSEHVYLYSPYGAEGFYKVEELDDYTSLDIDAESRTLVSRNRSARMGIETLFKWTEEGYAARRRISWEQDYGGGRTVYEVYDRSPAATLMPEPNEGPDAWVLTAQWETAGESDPDGELSPWLDPDYFGPDIIAPTEIPQDLTDFLLPLVAADTWRPFARQFAAGKKLDPEVAEKLFEQYTEGWAEPVAADYIGTLIDADNDGTADAFIRSIQGTGRFCSFDLLCGQVGRKYVWTDFGTLGSRVVGQWISWNGSRYLLVPSYDCDTRAFAGLDVYLFHSGKITRRARLEREAESYQPSDAWAAKGYEAVLTDLIDRAPDLWAEFERTWDQPVGTAERLVVSGEEKHYTCDWNNDGVEEEYRKWTSSANAFGRYLRLDGMDGSRLGGADPSQGENLQILWIDRYGEENLIYTACNWGDQPIHLEVRRCAGDQTELVVSLTLTAEHAARLAAYETAPS